MFRRFRETCVIWFALLALFGVVGHAQSLRVYPVPEGMQHSDQFQVRVRVPGGSWKSVECYGVEVNMRKPVRSSMAYFDFTGSVQVSISTMTARVQSVRIRPESFGIVPQVHQDEIVFTIDRPRNLSIELNGDPFANLHLFAGTPMNEPSRSNPSLLYFGPGLHVLGHELRLQSGQAVYLAPGAVLKTSILCDHVSNVRITGHGILWQAKDGIRIDHSDHVTIDGITILNPDHYSVLAGDAIDLSILDLKSFSSKGWGDGIDLFSSKHVLVDGVFMRNSDDNIAIYGHRWTFYGDSDDITVQNSTLWADVAHPILVGTHGDSDSPETIEHLTFRNIDVLRQDEPQIDYQGCLALNASDGNLISHVLVDDMRVEDIVHGQLVNFRVTFNRKYAKAPGRGIEDVYVKNLSYDGASANLSIISGYDDSHAIRNVTFEGLRLRGALIYDHMPGKPAYYKTSDMADMFVGDHVENLIFSTAEESSTQRAQRP